MANTCTHYLKYRDTRPVLTMTLYDADGEVYDLTGADAVWLHVRLEDGGVFSRQMTSPLDDTGVCSYTWLSTDWTSDPALYPGTHRVEVEVLGPGAVRASFPNRDDSAEVRNYLVIGGDAGQATA